jgi:hypothetical protein
VEVHYWKAAGGRLRVAEVHGAGNRDDGSEAVGHGSTKLEGCHAAVGHTCVLFTKGEAEIERIVEGTNFTRYSHTISEEGKGGEGKGKRESGGNLPVEYSLAVSIQKSVSMRS